MPDVTIRRVGAGESPGAWARALGGEWMRTGEMLKREGSSSVWRGELDGRAVVVKTMGLDSPRRRFTHALHAGRLDRQWRGAAWLTRAGFATAAPLALATSRGPAGRCAHLVLEALPGRSVLDHLADEAMGVREAHALAEAVGGLVAALAAAGRCNRDGKPSNLLVTAWGETPTVAIVDTVAIRRSLGARGPTRMLASLVIEPRGCGVAVRRALLARGLCAFVSMPKPERRGAIRRWWRAVGRVVEAHGAPPPRVDPIRRSS